MKEKVQIEAAWDNRELTKDPEVIKAVENVIEALNEGIIRVAEPNGDTWLVNDWIKKAILLYFPMQKMELKEVGIFEYHDKMKL